MDKYKKAGDLIRCNGGVAPIPLMPVTGHGVVAGGMSLVNANDNKPMICIKPFGVCTLKPPTPAGPVPCIPVTIQPWSGGDTHFMVDGAPALTKDSFLSCSAGGGVIKFV